MQTERDLNLAIEARDDKLLDEYYRDACEQCDDEGCIYCEGDPERDYEESQRYYDE